MVDIETVGIILGVIMPFIYAIKRQLCKEIQDLKREVKESLDKFHPRT